MNHIRCVWLWGPSGCGKNKWIHEHFNGSVYAKSLDRYWDFYQGENVITFDNMVPSVARFSRPILNAANKKYKWLKCKNYKCKPKEALFQWVFCTSVFSLKECYKKSRFLEEMLDTFEVVHFDDINSLLNK